MEHLSIRQRELWKLLLGPLPAKEIAVEMRISKSGMEQLVDRLFNTLRRYYDTDITSRVALMAMEIQRLRGIKYPHPWED